MIKRKKALLKMIERAKKSNNLDVTLRTFRKKPRIRSKIKSLDLKIREEVGTYKRIKQIKQKLKVLKSKIFLEFSETRKLKYVQ